MVGFQKALFDNTYTVLTVVQDFSESMMNGFLKQFPWITDEVKKPLADSVTFCKTARNDYKKIVDESFDSWEKQAG